MQGKGGNTSLEVVTGNIVKMKLDAIVNAANSSLLGGGGVDGAIHRAAGPELVHECRLLGGCKTGQAKVTKAYNLPAKYIVHTVGPVWQGGDQGEESLLASCYSESMRTAIKHGARTIGFPAISTGRFRFPMDKAAKIAVQAVRAKLTENPGLVDRVVFVCFDEDAGKAFEQVLEDN